MLRTDPLRWLLLALALTSVGCEIVSSIFTIYTLSMYIRGFILRVS